MFELPNITEEEFKIYRKVEFAFYMLSVAQWAENKNRDLSQSEAEAMALDLLKYEPEDEFEYLDENYGEKQ